MKNYGLVIGLICIAALMRLVPHPANMTPVCAIALLGGAYLDKKWLSFVVPFAALFLSDLVLNNVIYKEYYTSFQFITAPILYLALASVVCVGLLSLRQITPITVITASVIGSILFFIISNIWSWQTDPMYTKDFKGLMHAYYMGLPFLGRSIVGDLTYSAVLFGLVSWAQRRWAVRELFI